MDIRLRPLREDEFHQLLRAQRAEYVRRLVDEAVGRVFWAPRGANRAYVYDLFIEKSARGQGVGGKALELVEDKARAEGLSGIDLNVWGRNDVARALCRTAGYYERAVAMSKELE